MSDNTNSNNKELQIISNNLPIGSLEAYIQRVNSIPMLTEEEEYILGKRVQENMDREAAQKLITSHLKYVVRVAKGYMGYGLQLSDLIQEGTVGLMKAVRKFDPEKGFRLVSFAVHWIKAEMHEYIIKNWRIVKIATTKAQRKLFFNLRNSKKRLGWFTNSEVLELANDLGVKKEEVLLMEQRMNNSDVAFELPNQSDEKDVPKLMSPTDYLESKEKDPMLQLEESNWDSNVQEKFKIAMQKLDPRSINILEQRWLSGETGKTLRELSDELGVSTERVRQLEKNAIEKLKKEILE